MEIMFFLIYLFFKKKRPEIIDFLNLSLLQRILCIKSVFGSVVADAFQITFRAKIHANDVFLFFKNYF